MLCNQVVETAAPGPGYELVEMLQMAPAQLDFVIEGRFGEFELKTKTVACEAWVKRQSWQS